MARELVKLGLGCADIMLIKWSENGWDWRAIRMLCGANALLPGYLYAEEIFRRCGY